MTDAALDTRRTRALPEWQVTSGGKKKTLGGRCSMERIAQELVASRHKTHNLGELAQLIHGANYPSNRDKVRRIIPRLRNYMMARLTPIVTTYGPRGRIEAIKAYEADEADDVRRLNIELHGLKDRKEITEEKYQQLREILSLPPFLGAPSS